MSALHRLISAATDRGHWLSITVNSEVAVIRVMTAPRPGDAMQAQICAASGPGIDATATQALSKLEAEP